MLFDNNKRDLSEDHEKLYAFYEILYTIVDFAAAVLFIFGSVMFFSEEWTHTGTWLFLIGSIFFAAKPALRVIRELKLAAIRDTEELSKRYKN